MAGTSESTPLLAKGTVAPPWGVRWRSSSWFITSTVSIAVATDMLCYMIITPVLPFRFEDLGYKDISQHVSWLMFAYSLGIITFIFPVAIFFHRNPWRRQPMLAAVVMLQLALVLFMKVEAFAAMFVARFMQGAASSVVFSVGFALICENVPEENVGRQVGYGMAGSSAGLLLAPPIGGSLYARYGWNAPFLFCIALCSIDVLARLLVIEQRDLPKYGIQPSREVNLRVGDAKKLQEEEELSLAGVVLAICRNRRGSIGWIATFLFGLVDGVLEPTLTLRVSAVWHKDSHFIGMIYLCAAVACAPVPPLFGHLSDVYGSEFVMSPMFAIAIPLFLLLRSDANLPAFIVFYALAAFCINSAVAPNGHEVAMAAKQTKGISEIHQFAALNLAYATSSALGAIAGGQMYDRTSRGWDSVMLFCVAACALGAPVTGLMAGNQPLLRRIARWRKSDKDIKGNVVEDDA